MNKDIQLAHSVKAKLMIVDSTQTASKSQQHGVAFWVAGRLVGKPSWSYGNTTFLDGRLKPAKRYTVIIQSDDLINEVLPDWTGFIASHLMSSVYSAVKNEVDEFMKSIMVDQIRELRQDVINDSLDDLEELSLTGKRDISNFLENVTERNPIISQEFLKAAVDALIITEKTKNGATLLSQLSQLNAEKIDTLSDLLSTWDVNDIASVLNEVDKRILVIEAIEKLYRDPKTDELHVLHPLVLNA
ncbi:MAG: ATP-binding protein, partial [Candidatus Ornithomonoglobus sp.]